MTTLRFPGGLYGVTPEWDDTGKLLRAVRLAAAGGMRALQLRRKNLPEAQVAAQARALAPLCRELGVVFLINDYWRLAIEVGANGVHLGRDDADPMLVRKEAGAGLIIGVSCYNELDRAERLLEAEPDYLAFGAVFPSPTKPQTVHAPLSLIAQANDLATDCNLPRPAVVAIGGITPDNIARVVESGADSAAVITGLFEAHDIAAAAHACATAFLPEPAPGPES